jgi:four helix bundle protein
MAHQPIEELEVFRTFESLADWVWETVEGWRPRAQNTIGDQLTRAMDSVNANLVEGDARYSLPDSIRFFIIARASAREARLWINRAIRRQLVREQEGLDALTRLDLGARMLNQLINYRRSAQSVRESRADYEIR